MFVLYLNIKVTFVFDFFLNNFISSKYVWNLCKVSKRMYKFGEGEGGRFMIDDMS